MRKPFTLASLAVASIAITPMLGVGAAFAADGAETGNGGAASATDPGLLALGGGALLLAVGAGIATTRRARVSA